MFSSTSSSPDQTPDQNPQSVDSNDPKKKKKKKKAKGPQLASVSTRFPQSSPAEPLVIYREGRLSVNESQIAPEQVRYNQAVKTVKELFPDWGIEMCRMIALIFARTAHQFALLDQESCQISRRYIEGNKIPAAQLEGALKIINGAEERGLTDGATEALNIIQEYVRDYNSSAIFYLKLSENLLIEPRNNLDLIKKLLDSVRFLATSGIDSSLQICCEYSRLRRNFYFYAGKVKEAFLFHRIHLFYLAPEKRNEVNDQFIKILRELIDYYQQSDDPEQKKWDQGRVGKTTLVVDAIVFLKMAEQGPDRVLAVGSEGEEKSELSGENISVDLGMDGYNFNIPSDYGSSFKSELLTSLSEYYDSEVGPIIYPQQHFESLSDSKVMLDKQFENFKVSAEFKKLENKKNQLKQEFLRYVERHRNFVKKVIQVHDISGWEKQGFAENYFKVAEALSDLEHEYSEANAASLMGPDKKKGQNSASIQSQLTELDSRFKKLQLELNESEAKCQASIDDNKVLNDKLNSTEAERQKLLEEIRNSKAEYDGQLAKLQKDRNTLLDDQKVIQGKWSNKLEKMEITLAAGEKSAHAERERFNTQLKEEQAKLQALTVKHSEAQVQGDNLSMQLEAEKSMGQGLSSQLAEFKESFSSKQTELESVVVQLEAEKNKNQALSSQLTELQGSLASVRQENANLAAQLEAERQLRLRAEADLSTANSHTNIDLAIERDKYSHLIASYNQLQSMFQTQSFFAQMQQQQQLLQAFSFGGGHHTPAFFPTANGPVIVHSPSSNGNAVDRDSDDSKFTPQN